MTSLKTDPKSSLLDAVQSLFTTLMHKYMPEPFTIVILLTLLTGVLAITLEGWNPIQVVEAWGHGFWDLLAFTTQVVVILAAGYVLARTPLVDRLLERLVKRVRTPRQAIFMATLIGGLASLLNWGFGLVVGGLIAKKLALGVKGVHYPLIISAAYSGFTLYAFGFSSIIPVLVSTPGHPLESAMGVIPLTETAFAWPMLVTAVVVLIVLLTINPLLHPKHPSKVIEIDPERHSLDQAQNNGEAIRPRTQRTLAERLNHSRLIGIGAGLVGLLYLAVYLVGGKTLNINTINFALLFLGILLMQTPAAYVEKLGEAIKTVSGIVLSFPFYAGIMAIMASSGLVATLAGVFAEIATPGTLPVLGLISSYLINMFAPSAGGHWIIQGPFMVQAATELGSSLPQNAMAVMLGNAWNDIVQPFWLLPVLALSRLKLKDIMGYLVIMMTLIGVVYVTAVLLWGLLTH